MPVKVIAFTTVNPNEPEALAAYLGTTGPLLDGAGARIVERYEVVETVMGEPMPRAVTIVEYPSREAIDQVFQSSEYLWLGDIRRRAFAHYQISIIEGEAERDQ